MPLTCLPMAIDPQQALDAWKNADANARAAESLLKRAWEEFEAGRITRVPETLIRSVSSLRGHANDKLTVALQALSGPSR